MSNLSDRIAALSPEQRALLEQRLRSSSRAEERDDGDRVAVLGIGCRFPGGVRDAEGFWRLLSDGVDAIAEVPATRWSAESYYDEDVDAAGKMNTRWGGFIDRIDEFDADFFGISPREAKRMDPQQRLLLEVGCEALEDAGQPLDRVAGTRAGVFIGIHSQSSDYHLFQLGDIGAYTGTGTAHSIAANRLSYCLDLRGPSLAVDTACSASLVAVHLAFESLRRGESDLALAGGVNLMLSPESTIACSKLQMMASDGRCKTFDRAADGFVRGEGCGVVVLKRLSDALADGDDVLAVIAGSAINQDGRTNGLTAPNGLSQEDVIRRALAVAGVSGSDISYVEAHGTGTALGDPIEVEALASVLGPGRRPDRECVLGSVKTNIGHLEGAAGIAGLIKAVLCLRNGAIPPHLHYHEPNPHLSLESTPFSIHPTGCAWPVERGGRLAGVSSFGFGGTNAHAVLAEAPERAAAKVERATPSSACLLPISARSPEALRQLAEAYRDLLSADLPAGADQHDVCAGAALRRAHHDHRLAVVGRSPREVASRLDDFLGGETGPALLGPGVVRDSEGGGLVWVFSGQGPQWPGMGRDLLDEEPVFREAVERCDRLVAAHAGWSLLDELRADEGRSRMHETEVAQPVVFALQVGQAALWRSWGLAPEAVVGHSVGEVAAAHVSGALGLEDAVRLVCERGRIMQKAAGSGRMLAVRAGAGDAAELVRDLDGAVTVAAVNGPGATVLSGDASALEELHRRLGGEQGSSRLLRGDHAFHSPAMERLGPELEEALRGISPGASDVPMISTVTGLEIDGAELGAGYWRRNMCEPVRFASAIEHLAGRAFQSFIELSPHPVLAASIEECLAAAGVEGSVVSSFRRGRPGGVTMLAALGQLYVDGLSVDWKRLHPDGARPVVLPKYPWQHRTYWLDRPSVTVTVGLAGDGHRAATDDSDAHPLLGRRTDGPLPTFESSIGALSSTERVTHWLDGVEVLPLTHVLGMVEAAAVDVFGPGAAAIENVAIERALLLSGEAERDVQLVLVPSATTTGGGFQLFSRGAGAGGGDAGWTRHVTGDMRVTVGRGSPAATAVPLEAVRARCPDRRSGQDYYAELDAQGYTFSAGARMIESVSVGDGEALGELRPGGEEGGTLDLVFGGLQLLNAVLPPSAGPEDGRFVYAPSAMGALRLHGRAEGAALGHVRVRPDAGGQTEVELDVLDASGRLVAEVRGLTVSRVRPEALLRDARRRDDWLYEVEWTPQPAAAEGAHSAAEPGTVVERLGEAAGEASGFERLLPELEALCAAYVVEALGSLGRRLRAGDRLDVSSTASELGVLERHRPLFHRLFGMLLQDGIVREVDGVLEVIREPDAVDPGSRWQDLRSRYPAFYAELSLLGRCAHDLADVLVGRRDPLELLFPDGSIHDVERIYGQSPQFAADNELLGRAVAEAARIGHEASTRAVRVLEVGAGTGGTTASVLPLLPDDGIEYVFSDVSSRFTSAAQERFAAFDAVRYATLDIERSPSEQGFEAGSFDVVVAANVLHATSELRRTLRHVTELLAPGGLLVLFEATRPQRWIDLTFGLTEGWWRFADRDLRPSYPLLSREGWTRLLPEMGLGDVRALRTTGESEDGEPLQSLLISRKGTAEAPGAAGSAASWVVFADAGGFGEAVAGELERRGHRATTVRAGTRYRSAGDGRFEVDPVRREDVRRVFAEVVGEGRPIGGVVHLWSLDAPAPEELTVADLGTDRPSSCAGVMRVAQEWAATAPDRGAKLWVVTRGAQSVPADGGGRAVAQAPAWGLGRGIALEDPEAWGGLIDVDPESDGPEARALAARLVCAELEGSGREDQVAHRGGERYVPRLRRRRPARAASGAPRIRRDGSYLVTGGFGRLGLQVARWLAERGAGHVALVGRTGVAERRAWDDADLGPDARRRVSAIRGIEALGTRVSPISADIGDPVEGGRVLERLGAEGELRGVVHAAGIADPRAFPEIGDEDLARTLRPKVDGAWVLHELTRDLDLDFFVLFSSTTGLLGAARLAHYGAGNHFLDALARHRFERGLPATSIAWGTWDVMEGVSASGMASEMEEVSRHGLRPMPADEALVALEEWIGRPAPEIVVADVAWDVLRPAYEAKRVRPFLSELGEPAPTVDAAQVEAVGRVLERVSGAAAGDRLRLLEEYVAGEVARVLGLEDARSVDVQKGLFEMGMDSLTSVDLKRRLERGVGATLPTTLTFNYPTVEALAGYLSTLAGPVEDDGVAADVEEAAADEGVDSPAAASDLTEDELAEELAARLRRLG